MPFSRSFLIALFCLIAFPAFAQDAKINTKKLAVDFQKFTSTETMKKTKIGIYAQDIETGEVLIDINGSKVFNPASNAKVVTSAVALQKFGASKVWATRLSSGEFANGEVKTLYIKGDGDPMLLYEDVINWAIVLKQKGVKKITGGIVIDLSSFKDTLPPGFEQQDEDASYRPDISSFSVNYNMVSVVVEPGKSGKPARVYMRPPNDHVKLVSNVKTDGAKTARIKLKVSKTANGTKITIDGKIGTTAPRYIKRKRIDFPSLFAGSILKKALMAVGIKVEGDVRIGERPTKTKTLHFHLSKPLWNVIALMNKYSNNFIAEQLYMLLGAQKTGPANVADARKAVAEFMTTAKVDAKNFKSFNGSGLYVGNLISPKQLVQTLTYMAKQDSYPEFAASLAVSGGDGTLRTRMRKHKGAVRGKTGTLTKVSALSGYATTKSGRKIAYSILFNDPPIPGARLRGIQDAMVDRLINFNQ